MRSKEPVDPKILRCVNQGRAIADVIGDPFATAEEYTLMDAGQIFMPLPPPGPTEEESLADIIYTAARHHLVQRFHVRLKPWARHAILKTARRLHRQKKATRDPPLRGGETGGEKRLRAARKEGNAP